MSERVNTEREQRLAAILCTDIQGDSKQLDPDEVGTIGRLQVHNRIMNEHVKRHGGTVIETIGDAFMVEFQSTVAAVNCALDAQRAFAEYNAGRTDGESIAVRIGVHAGDVIVRNADHFGEAVNIAARLGPRSSPGCVCVSRTVLQHVRRKVRARGRWLGHILLKNIRDPVDAFELEPSDELLAEIPAGEAPRASPRRRGHLLLIATALVAVATAAAAVWFFRGRAEAPAAGGAHSGPLKLGVRPFLPAPVLLEELRPLVGFLERRIGAPVRLVVQENYDETITGLVRGDLDVAFLGPYPYLAARQKSPGVVPLVAGAYGGIHTYEGYLLVRRDDPFQRIEDLQGRRVCYVDRNSTSGYLMPRLVIRDAGFDPKHYFGSVQFSGNHHQAIKDLLAGRCDVAAVSSPVYVTARQQGIMVSATRILSISGQVPHDLLCAAPTLSAQRRAQIRDTLLGLDVQAEFGVAALGDALALTGFEEPRLEMLDRLAAELKVLDGEKDGAAESTPAAP